MRIKPFRAIRPDSGTVDQIATAPLENFSLDDAMTIIDENKKSFLRILLAESDDVFNEFIDEEWLIKEDKPAYYIYRLYDEANKRSQFAVVGAVNRDEIFSNQEVNTTKTEKIKHLVETIQAYPLLPILTTPAQATLSRCLAETRKNTFPLASFDEDDGTNHCIWRITDEETIQKITGYFQTDTNKFKLETGQAVLNAAASLSTKDNYIPAIIFSDKTNVFTNALEGLFLYDLKEGN